MFEGIIFKSDGLRYNILTGVWSTLSSSNLLNTETINCIGGIGTGAIFAILCALDYDSTYIQYQIASLYESLNKTYRPSIMKLLCYETDDMLFQKTVVEFVEHEIIKVFQKRNVTFKDLYMKNTKYLRLLGYNLTKGKIENLDFFNTPSMFIIDAFKICLCDPSKFPPISLNDSMYIDSSLIYTSSYTMFMDISVKCFLLIDIRNNNRNVKCKKRENIIFKSLQNMKDDIYVPANVEVLTIEDNRNDDRLFSKIDKKTQMYYVNIGEFNTVSFLKQLKKKYIQTSPNLSRSLNLPKKEISPTSQRYSLDEWHGFAKDNENLKERNVLYMNKLN